MRRTGFLVCGWLIAISVAGQLMVTNPALPTDIQQVVVTYNAALGNQGLMGYTGDVYIHTGVITDKSASSGDWKYVKADWTVNIPACKMTRSATDTYTITIGPSIREFYGVPSGEKIVRIAMVFRSGDRTKEGKDTGGKDIYATVYESGVNVSFSLPSVPYQVLIPGSGLDIIANATNQETIDLYLDDNLLLTQSASVLNYHLVVPSSGKHLLRVKATGPGGENADSCWFVVHETTVAETRPAGVKRGVNLAGNQNATFMIYAPDKEYIYLAGDFNGWMPGPEHQMKRDGNYFWLTIGNLQSNTEYAYQYWIDNALKIADPYANKILDPWNDKYISASVYPNLKAYPTGKTDEIVSVFNVASNTFNWSVPTFTPPSPDTLVIYELLIRDFTTSKDIKSVIYKLSYLKELGINAIELMPFSEFEGNDSWGYNPSFYFAPDKAYGTISDYKSFIDACHQNGIAVIQDMVLNHSFSQSPFVRMYFDGTKPAANNPWYNVNHNMLNPDAQWGYDFNHESPETQALVDSICAFWMDEFKIDGFRFDFTKGFTNTVYGPSDWASAYDASRIALLKRMTDQIKARKPSALVIFEHLSDNTEEKELANHGILLWGNHNSNYNEGTMGYTENQKSDLSWTSYANRGWDDPCVVNYMESHDEERLMYKNLSYGASSGSYSVKQLPVALQRMKLAGAFFFTLPGPKMIWQFGELGYDESINLNGRTGHKPPHWEYMDDSNRKSLFNGWAALIQLKKQEPVFSSEDFTLDVSSGLKRIDLNHSDGDVVILGNFYLNEISKSFAFPSSGWWYNYFNGDSLFVENRSYPLKIPAGEFALLSSKKLIGYDDYVVPNTSPPDQNLFCYPIPCHDEMYVHNPFESEGIVTIRNIKGEKIGVYFIDRQTLVDLSPFMGALFLVQVESVKGEQAIQKIIKK